MEWKRFTWSDVVYPGTEVYSKLVMFDFSGVCGSSEYVVYNTLSVQDGVLPELSGQESAPHRNLTSSHPPVFVDFANPVSVRALQKPDKRESWAHNARKTKRERLTLNFQKSPSLSPTNTVPFFRSTLNWSYSFNSSLLLSLSSAATKEACLSGPCKGCASGRSRRKLRSPKKKRWEVS